MEMGKGGGGGLTLGKGKYTQKASTLEKDIHLPHLQENGTQALL